MNATNEFTRAEIEAGTGLFSNHRHTLIFQRGDENVFVTADKDSRPGPGYHLAGGGRILKSGDTSITWCDAR